MASPDRTALEVGGTHWTYLQLDADATSLATQLLAMGVAPGDRVASLLRNGAAPVVLVHAVLRAGATLVPLNLRLRDAEVAWQLADSGASLLIAEGSTAELAGAAIRELGTLESPSRPDGHHTLVAHMVADAPGAVTAQSEPTTSRGARPAALRLVHDGGAVLAIIYTSGTTGRPKGAKLTVANFWWSAVGSALNLGAHADERWLAVLPLFHIGGLSIVLRSAIHGTTIIVQRGFDADEANRALDEGGITIISVVAVMLQRMVDARGDRAWPASLRCVLLGGGPAPASLLERCAASGIPVVQTYGLTEACSQVATLSPADALRKQGSAGRPLYPNAVRIARADGSAAGPGEAGEILVRGPIVMAGYHDQPDATARAIVDGWLHTGDIGSLDAEGFLQVHDRRDDLIITGGENVYPAEVEAAMLRHPWVAEVGVIGLPDDSWGQRVVAIVRLSEAAPADEDVAGGQLRAHCRSLLAGYKVPADIRMTREPLPRTASGKLRRAELRTGA